MNQTETSLLSEVLNPNYEDLSRGWGATSFPSLTEDLKSSPRDPEGPEYLNTAQSSLPLVSSLDNPDYKPDFLPQTNGLFVPAAENQEYLGLATSLQTPIC